MEDLKVTLLDRVERVEGEGEDYPYLLHCTVHQYHVAAFLFRVASAVFDRNEIHNLPRNRTSFKPEDMYSYSDKAWYAIFRRLGVRTHKKLAGDLVFTLDEIFLLAEFFALAAEQGYFPTPTILKKRLARVCWEHEYFISGSGFVGESEFGWDYRKKLSDFFEASGTLVAIAGRTLLPYFEALNSSGKYKLPSHETLIEYTRSGKGEKYPKYRYSKQYSPSDLGLFQAAFLRK